MPTYQVFVRGLASEIFEYDGDDAGSWEDACTQAREEFESYGLGGGTLDMDYVEILSEYSTIDGEQIAHPPAEGTRPSALKVPEAD